ncbi:MAG: hypothetical protein J6K19_06145 [Prevotella sp.]|nr:hypothetical protein [Prevotella sp.]
MIRRVFILLVIASTGFIRPSETKAQQLQAALSHYSMDNGLVSNNASDIKQDDYGYIWIATWNGLSRFDGINFYNYETGYGSNVPLLHNRIIDLSIDLSQNIWMRMYDGRIFVLNRSTDRIENPLQHITGYQSFKTSSPIKVTSNGDVLAIINGVGLYKMRLTPDGVKTDLVMTGKLKVSSIVEGYKGDLWVGTDDGIHRVNINDETIERNGVFTGESINCMYSNGYNIYAGTKSGKIVSFAYGQEPNIIKETGEGVSSIFVDSHNIIWFTGDRQGISRLIMNTGDIKDFTQSLMVPEFDVHGAKVSEVNGTVWMTMNHGGFGYYNREADEVEYFHNAPTNSWNLSNTVSCFLVLPEGVVWESTVRRGLEKLEIVKKTIGRTQLFANSEATSENDIRALFYDSQRKTLLIGNKNSSLFFMRSGQEPTVITSDGNGNTLGRIYGITKGRNGEYWICSKGTGLIKMEPKGNGFAYTFFKHDPKNPMSISSNNAYCSVEDKNGNIWIATYGGGVNILTKNKNGGYVFLNSKNAIHNYPYNDYHKVRTLAADKDGNIWVGSTDGLLIMSYENNRIRIQKVTGSAEREHNLMSNDIVSLACDKNGSMWIGTNGGGLSHTIGKDDNGNWIFETFNSKDGLPSDEIKSMTFDERGNVWFATDHILCSFDIHKKIFSTFSSLDGVDGTICSEGAAICMPNGNILFGTLNGYYTIDRKKLTTSTGSMLKLKITDFYLNDELMSPRLNDRFTYYVPDSKSVSLPGHNNVISFRFTSLNYQLQHRVHYQYKLEGYDSDWINADNSRTVSYSGLPSGTYRFCVKAFLLESPDKFDLRTIEVVVPPYFLLSSDAIWIYLIVIALGILAFIYMRQRHMARLSRSNGTAPEQQEEPSEKAKKSDGQNVEEVTDDYEIIDNDADKEQ